MSAIPMITPAECAIDAQGVPMAPAFGDVYHSAQGAAGQARHVFLGGNGLPQRWRGARHFTILETGFGLGLNFLATWQAWRDDPARSAWLHFVSVERHPLRDTDLPRMLGAAIAGEPGLAMLAAQLVAAWPLPVPGLHRREFDGGSVTLTLAYGAAGTMLPQLVLRADAIYLDGFAPDRNPDMWSPQVFSGVARHAAAGATLSTYSAAAAVREGLVRAGFAVERVPGFAGKRHMLRATRHAGRVPPAALAPAGERHALVIGAGLAGCGVAHALARRGWRITLLDARAGTAQASSGNLAGTFHPLFARDDTPLARLTRNAFLHGGIGWQAMRARGAPVDHAACGVLQLPGERQGAAGMPDASAWPAALVRNVDRAEAAALTGADLRDGGLWFEGGGWLAPASLCQALLHDAGAAIAARYGIEVAACDHDGALWHARDASGASIASAPVIVFANALDAARLDPRLAASMRAVRGQVSHLPATTLPGLRACVTGRGYLMPAVAGSIVCGASYQPGDAGTLLRSTDHAANLARCNAMLATPLPDLDVASLGGRVGIRAVTHDRLPLIGALGGAAWCASGFASRGILWSGLAGQIIAAQLEGEPAPLERALLRAIDPLRFADPAPPA